MHVIAARLAGLAALLLCAGAQAQGWLPPLRDGLDGPDFAATGGLYYRQNAEQAAGTVEFQNAVKLTGAGALKLSVRARCAAGSEDCSERAEIWEKTELRVPYDQGVWYGFAVKFGDPVPTDNHRYLIAQWKREIDDGTPGDFSQFLALRLRKGKLFATVETNFIAPDADAVAQKSCPAGSAPVWFRPEANQMRALVATDAAWQPEDGETFKSCTKAIAVTEHGNKLPLPSSGWIDFAIYTRPGPDGHGHIEIFANGKPVVTITGHIGHSDKGLGKDQYFKFGPYRAGHSSEWTLFYDDFRRSPNCADVMKEGQCPLLLD